ncbi:MAG: hypothetical protein AAF391_10945, partial [Bacteroidota bacterium]
ASDKVKAAYSEQEIQDMTVTDVDKLNFQAEMGFAIAKQRKDIDGCISSSELTHRINGNAIQVSDLEDLNILEFDFVQEENHHTSYCFENGTVLMIYSKARLETLYERNKINTAGK